MEIARLSKSGLRLKGKQASFAIDHQDKNTYNALLLMEKSADEITPSEETVVLAGPGEYEIGGVKMTGFRSEADMLYSLSIDGVEILVGKLDSLEKMQNKLKEHQIVVVNCTTSGSASFITTLAQNVVMFYGEQASGTAALFGKENVKQMNKYTSTKDKLPTEVETVLLASSV